MIGPINTVELFAGRQSFSRVAARRGMNIYTVEKFPEHGIDTDLAADVSTLIADDLPRNVDIVWASPPCQGFSIASVSHHWRMLKGGGREPKSVRAAEGMEMLRSTVRLIRELRPRFWFIENPRGTMRKVIDSMLPDGALRAEVTYCQYGDTRMKPTDIWHNCPAWTPRPMCKNGQPCHVAAPRGAKTGTQGLKGAAARSEIPGELFREIFDAMNAVDTWGAGL